MIKKRTYIYRGFERFWHWSQALLIFFLALTGFEIHGTFKIFGFENVVRWHDIAAIAFLVLIIFAIFWHFVTGEWRQYIPTTKYMSAQIKYYITGIFKGADHPTHKTIYNKFNPLQRMIYLGLKLLVIPIQVVTGLVYMLYVYPNDIVHVQGLSTFALIHTFGAFILMAFVIAHVYLTTTGDTPLSSIKAMITGWEVIDVDKKEERIKHLQEAIDNSAAGYYRLDSQGNFTEVNAAWLKMFKCNDPSQIIGKHYSFTRKEKDQPALEKIANRVMKGEIITSIPATRVCMDGSIAHHLLSANPIIEEGEVTGIEGFILDIKEVEEMDEHMHRAVRNSSAGYYRLDQNGLFVDVNETWLKLYQYQDKNELVGKHFSITRKPSDRKNLEEIFKKVMNGEALSGKLSNRLCKDGSVGKHILSANPVYIGNKIVGMEGFILDVSDLKL